MVELCWRCATLKMMKEIKDRIINVATKLKKHSLNLNGNHQRTIDELEERKKDITELINNLEDKQKERKTTTRIKLAWMVMFLLFSLVIVNSTINNNINGVQVWSVTAQGANLIGDLNITGGANLEGNLTVDTIFDNTIYAQLSSSVDQIPLTTDPEVITYNIQDEISGLNHSTSVNPGEITITTDGIYFVSPQPQVGKDLGGVKVDFDMFLQVNRNGTFLNENNSNIKLTIKDPDITDVIVLAFTIQLEAGEKIRMMQKASTSSVGMGLKNTNATSDVPRTPSIIFTMYRIGN